MFFKALRKRTSVELPESIKTPFTSYSSISVVMTNISLCEQMTCSIFDSEIEMITSSSTLGHFPVMVVPET